LSRHYQIRESFAREEYATEEVVELSPLPCQEHLSPEEHRAWVAELRFRSMRHPEPITAAGRKAINVS
jgi:hypothetical protein